ncbi:hypothetical protein DFJ58DRAFT_661804, partial [Suillus subalutaceus]|uniref:uncharacterized protein n=1 Tax=Suillus subalutaceus TaxID=48586 RepID=UPI001B8817AB
RPVDHPDHAAALTNLTHVHLQGYIQNHLQDIDTTATLFCEALALRPQGHPDRTSSIYHLIIALNWRYRQDLPINASDEGIHLQRNAPELCPVGQLLRPKALGKLAYALRSRSTQRGNIDDIDESIQIHLRREAIFLRSKGHSVHDDYLNHLALSLTSRLNHQGKPNDLNEVISWHMANSMSGRILTRPYDHLERHLILSNLSSALCSRFTQTQENEDAEEAITLC